MESEWSAWRRKRKHRHNFVWNNNENWPALLSWEVELDLVLFRSPSLDPVICAILEDDPPAGVLILTPAFDPESLPTSSVEISSNCSSLPAMLLDGPRAVSDNETSFWSFNFWRAVPLPLTPLERLDSSRLLWPFTPPVMAPLLAGGCPPLGLPVEDSLRYRGVRRWQDGKYGWEEQDHRGFMVVREVKLPELLIKWKKRRGITNSWVEGIDNKRTSLKSLCINLCKSWGKGCLNISACEALSRDIHLQDYLLQHQLSYAADKRWKHIL